MAADPHAMGLLHSPAPPGPEKGNGTRQTTATSGSQPSEGFFSPDPGPDLALSLKHHSADKNTRDLAGHWKGACGERRTGVTKESRRQLQEHLRGRVLSEGLFEGSLLGQRDI